MSISTLFGLFLFSCAPKTETSINGHYVGPYQMKIGFGSCLKQNNANAKMTTEPRGARSSCGLLENIVNLMNQPIVRRGVRKLASPHAVVSMSKRRAAFNS